MKQIRLRKIYWSVGWNWRQLCENKWHCLL